MPPHSPPADPALVLELIQAFRRSKSMFAAVELGVFDALADRPRQLDEIAGELGCDADALERLLDACVGLGLLARHDGGYHNTDAANTYLTTASPHRLTGYIGFSNDAMWRLWSHLTDAVREGGHRWRQAYGWDGPVFSHFFKTEAAKREFLMGMHGFGMLSSPVVVAAFDLSRFKRLVDLGGATGHLATAACERYPNLRAVVFELPEATAMACEMIAGTQVSERVEVIGGDFFNDPLPAADLYSLGRILHDWTEAKVRNLLERVFAASPKGGAVLIAEKLLADDKSGPGWAQMQNLNMLTCTEGKERTLAEDAAILESVRFSNVRGAVTTSPLDAVMAEKV